MPLTRAIERIIGSNPTLEGAGVHLRRVFGYYERGLLDPSNHKGKGKLKSRI